jgi:hypothetical protein
MTWVLTVAAMIGLSEPAAAQQLQAVRVVGTELQLMLDDGRTLARDELVGAVLTLRAEDGERRRVKIESIMPDPRDRTGEVLLYGFATPDAAGAWRPLCPPDPNGRQLGFPQPGPHGDIVIWCTAGALGKCVRAGYHPWRTLPDGTALAPYHRACVAMMRADYCGDGRPTTRDGTLIDIYDRIGVNPMAPEDGEFRFEAAWGEEGALCVAKVRIPENVSLDGVEGMCPRLAGRVGAVCREDTSVAFGTPLVFNRSR